MSRRKRMLEELDRDIRQHLEQEIEENVERGMPPEEARRAALLKFGNPTLIKENTRAVWSPVWLEQLLQDLRYGLRMLRRSPGFTAVAVATLCLGIGVNTAVFSVVRAALLRPLPYPDASRLVWLSDYDRANKEDFPVSRDIFLSWWNHAKSFEKLAASADEAGRLLAADGTQEEEITAVSGDFWSVTGARPFIGRLFGPAELDKIVISYDLFEQAFGGDPKVIGQAVSLDGHSAIVTGVLEKGFRLLPTAGGSRPRKRQGYIPIPLN